MTEIRRVGTSTDMLGEGPVWSIAEQALYWVDIPGKAVRRWRQASDEVTSWAMPEMVGSLALREKGGILLALRPEFSLLDPETGKITPFAQAPNHDSTVLRFNDGKCDRQGRFWVGTMTVGERKPLGRLYRLDGGGCSEFMGGIDIPNSLCWSPDGRTMYFSDSPRRVIWAFDYDPDTGEARNRRDFASVEAPMVSDGATVDAEGFLWSANFHGWRVTRFTPDGRVDRVLELPASNITSCAFGGPDLTTLFITCAGHTLTPEQRAAQPLAGALLAVEVGVKGLPEPGFAF